MEKAAQEAPISTKLTVCARLRPIINEDYRQANVVRGAPDVCVHFKQDGQTIKILQDDLTQKLFRLDYTFDISSTQTEIYNIVGRPIVSDTLKGYNGSIMAYGPTAAGKTYTIFGSETKQGLCHFSINDIYDRIQQYEETERVAKVYITFYQIYLDQIYDLLQVEDDPQSLNLREQDGMPMIENLIYVYAKDRDTANEVIRQGLSNRRVYSSNFNMRSSRSHAILQFHIDMEESDEVHGTYGRPQEEEKASTNWNNVSKTGMPTSATSVEVTYHVRRRTLTFVDLAGSERISAHKQASKQAVMETTSINKSIAELGNCIAALASAQGDAAAHIPFRNSKLTRILAPWLSSQICSVRTVIIANINPCSYALEETLSTMKFATRAKQIRSQKSTSMKAPLTPLSIRAERLSYFRNENPVEVPLSEKEQHHHVEDNNEDNLSGPVATTISSHPARTHSSANLSHFPTNIGVTAVGEVESSFGINSQPQQLPNTTTANNASSFNLREFLRACTIANRLTQTQQFLVQHEEQKRQQQLQNELKQQQPVQEEMNIHQLSTVENGASTPRHLPLQTASTFNSFPSPAFTIRSLDSEALNMLHGHSLSGESVDASHLYSQSRGGREGIYVQQQTEIGGDVPLNYISALEARGMVAIKPTLSMTVDEHDRNMAIGSNTTEVMSALGSGSTRLQGGDIVDTSPGLLPAGNDKHSRLLASSKSSSFIFSDNPRVYSQSVSATRHQSPYQFQAKRPAPLQLSRTSSLKSLDSFRLMQGSELQAFKQQLSQQNQMKEGISVAGADTSAPPTPSAATAAAARARLERQAQALGQGNAQSHNQDDGTSNATPSAKERYETLRKSASREFSFEHTSAVAPGPNNSTADDVSSRNLSQSTTAPVVVTPSPKRSPAMSTFTERLGQKSAEALLSLPPAPLSKTTTGVEVDKSSSSSLSPAHQSGSISADSLPPGSYQSIRRVIRRVEMTTQTDPPPAVQDKCIQTHNNLQAMTKQLHKTYLGQLDDFDEFAPTTQDDQMTQTEPIFLVSDYYGTADEQRELTDLALLDPLEIACCFLEMKKVVETQAEQIARLQDLILNDR